MKTGWKVRPLDKIARFCGGGTPSKSNALFWNGDIPWVSPKDMWVDEVTTSTDMISEEAVRSSATSMIPVGSILCVVRSGILARKFPVAITRRSVAINQDLKAIIPSSDISSEYLFYFLKASEARILASVTTGATVHRLSTDFIRNIDVPLPPLEEQRRIVAVLEKAFAGIATAAANAQKNLTNARALFETFAEALIEKHLDGETKAPLKSLTDRITNGYVGPTRDIYVDSGIPYLLARQVKNNSLKFDSRTYITTEFNEKIRKSKLIAGDVLLVQSGHIGHSAVVPVEHEGHNCHAMIVITPKPNLTGKFLSLFFNTAGMKLKFNEIRSGSTVPHLTCKLVRELLIPLPSVSKQIEIERECCEVREQTVALERNFSQKLASLNELKQSLLQKAFAGALT